VAPARRSKFPEFEKMTDLEIVQLLEAEARRLLLEDHSGGDGGKDGKDRS
jgi:hypothetical protein